MTCSPAAMASVAPGCWMRPRPSPSCRRCEVRAEGGIAHFDGQFDDAGLAIALARSTVAAGGWY